MIKIHDKNYMEVKERVTIFRRDNKGWKLMSEIVQQDKDSVTFKATVINDKNEIVSTGHAFEEREKTGINKTSFLENCETSAFGRALGFFGIGIDTAIASADEVKRAIEKQEEKEVKLFPNDDDFSLFLESSNLYILTESQIKHIDTLKKNGATQKQIDDLSVWLGKNGKRKDEAKIDAASKKLDGILPESQMSKPLGDDSDIPF